MNRPVYEIANEIKTDWGTKLSPYAKPYVQAMECLQSVESPYGQDSGKEIVLRFLCNAGSWRGETAKRVKTELKQMVGLK